MDIFICKVLSYFWLVLVTLHPVFCALGLSLNYIMGDYVEVRSENGHRHNYSRTIVRIYRHFLPSFRKRWTFCMI